jgi:predicted amidohydrolase YtcJ
MSVIKAVEEAVDTVLVNGKFYTVDEEKSWAEAVAIEDSTIVYVGSMEGIDPYIGKKTEVVDLKRKFAMPAFVDSHIHPMANAYACLYQAALFELKTTEEYIDKIREFSDANPDLKGIMGAGFERALYDSIGPRKEWKEWLDEIDSERPIAITSVDIHSMWVNSKTLQMLGFTKDAPDPEGGVIQRDPETGEPTGLIQEHGAMKLAWELFPSATKDEYKASLLWLQKRLNAEGITTAHDAWAEFDPNFYEAYDEMAKDGKLTVRYRGSWYIDPTPDYMEQIEHGFDLAQQYNHPHFKAHSFKFLTDQIIEEETALLIEPYAHRPDYYGPKDWTDEDMVKAFAKIDKAGYQIHVHVIGDGAARDTVNAFEKVEEINGKRDSRHSLAHIQLAKPEDVTKMGELGLSAHMSQYWMVMDKRFWDFYLPYLGPERAYNETYPHKSLFDAGVNVTVGSDWPTSEPDFMIAIYSGMKRIMPFRIYKELHGDDDNYRYVTDPDAELRKNDISYLPPASERVSLEEMLEAATINGAYANFLEDEVGSIEVGKKADIVVLSKNLFSIDTEEIPNVEIEMTFFEGKRVY